MPAGSGTVITKKTPWSSIHAVPSITGRRCSEYVPAVCGARTWKVNVAFAPGATLASVCAATRFAEIQLIASGAHCASSWLRPRRASCPSTPFVHACVPVLRKTMVSGAPT